MKDGRGTIFSNINYVWYYHRVRMIIISQVFVIYEEREQGLKFKFVGMSYMHTLRLG